ncbi:MAG: hypothetical protein LBS60_04000 [Deltaproteobacteria bacterium]|jgi:hypothetical protein|nr:hypothetical protein [Deltaproteobacteria bacterium]
MSSEFKPPNPEEAHKTPLDEKDLNGPEEVSAPDLGIDPLDPAVVKGKHQNPKYRGLYLLGPLAEIRSFGQERFSYHPDSDPYPPDIAEAIAERANILERLKDLSGTKALDPVKSQEKLDLLKSLSSLEKRLLLRQERLRDEGVKAGKKLGLGWEEYLVSLNGRRRFLNRNILELKTLGERAERDGSSDYGRGFNEKLNELIGALPEIPSLSPEKTVNLKRGRAVAKEAARVSDLLEVERLNTLDQILAAEELVSLGLSGAKTVGQAPEPVSAPRLIKEINLKVPKAKRPLKAITAITVVLLVLALFFMVVSKRFTILAPAPKAGRVLVVNGLSAAIDVLIEGGNPFVLGARSVKLLTLSDPKVAIETYLADGHFFIEKVDLIPPQKDDLERTLVYNVAGAAPLVELRGRVGEKPDITRSQRLPLGAPKLYYVNANVYTVFSDIREEPRELFPPVSKSGDLLGLGVVVGPNPVTLLNALKPSQIFRKSQDKTLFELIKAQALFNATWDEWTHLWHLRFAQWFPKEAKAAFYQRLEFYQDTSLVRKLLYSLEDQSGREALCLDTFSRMALEQSRKAERSLIAYCLPKDTKLPFISEQLKELKNDNDLTVALGRLEFDSGYYQGAYDVWKDVVTLNPKALLAEYDNFGRVESFLGLGGFDIYADLNVYAPDLSLKATLELGIDPIDPDRDLGEAKVYHLLALGRVDEAANLVTGSFRTEVLPLIAASVGARPEVIAEYQAQEPVAGLTKDNAWVKMALAIKLGQDSQKIAEFILANARDEELVKRILADLKDNGAQKLRDLLTNQEALLFGQACLVAYLTATDPLTQDDCRRKAKGFLFSSERPFLGSD